MSRKPAGRVVSFALSFAATLAFLAGGSGAAGNDDALTPDPPPSAVIRTDLEPLRDFIKKRHALLEFLATRVRGRVSDRELERRKQEFLALAMDGKFGEALPKARFYREVVRAQKGERHQDTLQAGDLLASLCAGAGDLEAALHLRVQLMIDRHEVNGERSAEYAESLCQLGRVYRDIGGASQAALFMGRAVEIYRRCPEGSRLALAATLVELAEALIRIDRTPLAEASLKEALDLLAATPRDADVVPHARALADVGWVYRSLHRPELAEPPLRRAETLLSNAPLDLPAKLAYARAASALAHVLADRGERAESARFRERAILMNDATHGLGNPMSAFEKIDLALEEIEAGELASARLRLVEALADLERAGVGIEESAAQGARLALASCLLREQEPDAALDAIDHALAAQEQRRRAAQAYATEAELLTLGGDFDDILAFALSAIALTRTTAGRATAVALAVARAAHGTILETMARRHATAARSPNAQVRSVYAEWQRARRACAEIAIRGPLPGETEDEWDGRFAMSRWKAEEAGEVVARIASLGTKMESAEVDAAAAPVTVGRGSALVQLVRYLPWTFRAGAPWNEHGEAAFAALVVARGPEAATATSRVIPLGPARAIEEAVRRWRAAMRREAPRAEVDAAGAALYDVAWKPLVPALSGCGRLYVVPDGELAFVSFGALPVPGTEQFLVESCDIGYLASPRDLARQGGAAATGPPGVVGDVDFDAEPLGATPTAGAARPGGPFPALEGTAAEVVAVAAALRKRGLDPRVLRGRAASEAAVKGLRRPAILHLATHGFYFAPTAETPTADPAGRGIAGVGPTRPKSARDFRIRSPEPLHRSGLALAGANRAVAAPAMASADDDDGLLTAEEAAALDLAGAEVVLSACDTGMGDLIRGEGVFGLRRSFAVAGARSIVMSLWTVSDAATRSLMELLYDDLARGVVLQRSLLQAQKTWIGRERAEGRFPKPYLWAAFVASGIGPFLGDP